MIPESIFTELELMQARIRSVPEGWGFSNIGKVFNICNNLRKPINEDERGKSLGEFPYYGPTKIQGYIGTYEQDGSYALIGEDGDHFLKFETQAMTQLVDGKCTVNNHAHIIEGTKKATREWFYYYFMHRDIFSFLSRQGAGRYKLNKASLEKIPLLVPPLLEQQKIAQILSTWDKAITTTEQLIANSQQQKKALMQQLLTGKKRLQGFDGEWKKSKLDQIVTINYGKSPKGVITGNGECPIFGTGGVIGCTNTPLCLETSVILGRKGTIDKPILIKRPFWAIDTTFYCLPKDGINIVWFYYLTSSINLEQYSEASGVPSLSRETLYSIHIFLPPLLEEQEAIASVLSAADREIEILQQKLDNLKQEKKALMQQLLTGKRRVSIKEGLS